MPREISDERLTCCYRAMARRLLRNVRGDLYDVDDLVQDAWVGHLAERHRLARHVMVDGMRHFYGFAGSGNQFVSHCSIDTDERADAKRIRELFVTTETPESIAIKNEYARRVRQAVAGVDYTLRVVAVKCLAEGVPQWKVGKLLHLSRPRMAELLRRATVLLRREYAKAAA